MLAQVPVITSVVPDIAKQGDTVIINGANFDIATANNIVYFGSVRGKVIHASSTVLKVIADTGAIFGPITVLNATTGLTGIQGNRKFLPTFRSDYFITDTINFKGSFPTAFLVGAGLGMSLPYIAVLGDLDLDGKQDVVVDLRGSPSVNGSLRIFANTSTSPVIDFSSLTSIQTLVPGNQPTNVKLADVDADGRLDIVVAVLGAAKFVVYRNISVPGAIAFETAGRSFSTSPAGIAPYVVEIADFDKDGMPDVALSSRDSAKVLVFRNTYTTVGGIDFLLADTPRCGLLPISLSAGDINMDGLPDISVADDSSETISVIQNVSVPGNISFLPRVILPAAGKVSDVQTVDIDGDGKLDIVTSVTSSNVIGLYRNICDAGTTITLSSFEAPQAYSTLSSPSGVAIGDINGDGKPDIAVSNAGTNKISIFRNTSTAGIAFTSGSFAAKQDFTVGTIPLGVSIGDINGDSYPEVLVANNYNGSLSVWRNYPLPPIDTIVGPTKICAFGVPVTYTDAVTGGVWKVTNSRATIDSVTGVLTPSTPGLDTIIYYTIAGGDSNSRRLIVRLDSIPSVSSVSGTTTVCAGASITLTNAVSGGTWSISDPAIATIGSVISGTTVTLTGIAIGPDTVSYSFTNTCGTDTKTTVVSVNTSPSPGVISGAHSMCGATTTSLSEYVTGGTWSSSAPSVATVGTDGTVYGVSAPGVTTISYTVSNTCGPSSATLSFTVNVAAVAGSISGPSTVCEGAVATLANAAPDGVWTSSNTTKATVSSTGIVTGVSAGAVTIKYKVTNSCNSDSATWLMTVNASPVAGVISGPAFVCATTTITLATTGTGGTWSSSASGIASVNSGGSVRGNGVGTAIISYSVGSAFCGTAVDTQMVTVNPQPVPGTITGTTSVCAGLTLSLGNTVTTGTWSSSAPATATVDNAGLVTALSAGVAIISYSVTNGCGTLSDTQAVRVNPQADAGTINGGHVVCQGQNLTLSNATTGGTWSSTVPGVATVSAVGIVHGVAGGNTIISYTVTNDCSTAVDTQLVTVNPLPVVNVTTGPTTVCVGADITLTNTTPGGVWGTSAFARATVTAGVVTGVSAGTVIISYTVANGCGPTADTILITVLAQPLSGTITGANSLCAGTNIALSGAAASGTWSSSNNGVATVAGGTVYGVAAGSAIITYSVTNSCNTIADTQLVNVQPAPDAGHINGSTTVCAGGATITLINTATSGTWSSSNTSRATVSDGVVTGVAAGNVIISYTAVNNCGTATDTQMVVVSPLPDAGIISGPSLVCSGGTDVTLTASLPGGVWGATNSNATVAGGVVHGVTAGADTITYSKTNSCGTDIATKGITIELAPVAGSISGPSSVCAGQSVTLTETVAGGVWSTSNARAAVSDSVVTGISQGNVTISYTVTNSCSTVHALHPMTIDTLPPAGFITGPPSVCTGTDITLTASVSGGVWSATNANATVSGGIVSGITLGADTIIYTTTNICGTNATFKSIVVNNSPYVDTIAGATVVCEASVITLTNTISGGVWTSADTTIARVDAFGGVTGIAGGTVAIAYAVTTVCGTATETKNVTVNPLPGAGVITGAANVCLGFSITLSDTATGGTWSATNANATVAGGIVTGISAGVDTIVYSVTNSCGSAAATYPVTIDALSDTGVITGGTMVCQGRAISLSNTVAGGTWNSSAPLVATVSASGVVTGLSEGDAVVVYTPGTGCNTIAAHHAVAVHVVPMLISPLTAPAICDSTTFTYTAASNVPAAVKLWQRSFVAGVANSANSGSDNISEVLDNTTPYPVTVVYTYTVSAAGCADTADVSVVVKPTPKLAGDVDMATCGATWFNYTPTSLTPGTAFAWTRSAVTGISPATASGIGAVHDSVVNTLGGSLTATYVFTLTAVGCTGVEEVHVILSEGAHQPHITTHPPSILCAATQFQNFGSTDTTNAGEVFNWSTSGSAALWATGATGQYSLVNFTTTGLGWVYLQNTQTSSGCALRDSFAVYVSGAENDHPSVTRFGNDFVCEASDEASYQWGYDDALTLDSVLLAGETNQNYYNASPDYSGKHYWVMTNHMGCMQKSYYNAPAIVSNVVVSDITLTMQPNPNSGVFSVAISSSTDRRVQYTLTDITGKMIREWAAWTNTQERVNVDAAAGLYFVTAVVDGRRFTEKVVIVK